MDEATEPTMGWRDGASDLLLGGSCAGCERPGRRLCRSCARRCRADPFRAMPDPPPAGLLSPPVLVVASTGYDGVVRALVIGLKEHRRLSAARPLGRLLAASVAAALLELDLVSAPVTLVPMPSNPAAVRRRGHDAVATLARQAARTLRRHGADVGVSQALRSGRELLDQAGLSAQERAGNLAGGLGLRRFAAGDPLLRRALVVVDDVVTTGSSAAEAVRVLSTLGRPPAAVATVAATVRRHPSVRRFPDG